MNLNANILLIKAVIAAKFGINLSVADATIVL